jgi:hypothetical protein
LSTVPAYSRLRFSRPVALSSSVKATFLFLQIAARIV